MKNDSRENVKTYEIGEEIISSLDKLQIRYIPATLRPYWCQNGTVTEFVRVFIYCKGIGIRNYVE
jgi:hypothetical protein